MKDVSVNKSRSNLSYLSCNYGEVFQSSDSHVNDPVLTTDDDYYFHYYDYMQNLFYSSKDVYAYKVFVTSSGTSFSGNNIFQQTYVVDTWDKVQSGDARSVLTTKENDSAAFWIVTDYSEATYYLGLLSYCRYNFFRTAGPSTTPVTSHSYASYSLRSNVKFTITPFTETGYYKEIADNTKETNQKLDEANKIAQDTNETTKGIFSSIKDFFGSFFQNLIDSVVSLFVPSAEEMGGLFDQLNQFFSDRFGFLYAPFDYMIKLMNVFLSSTGSTGITLPGFSIMGYEVWTDQTYDLSSDPLVGTILGYVRIGTGILLSGYFIMFLQNFFKERFGSG